MRRARLFPTVFIVLLGAMASRIQAEGYNNASPVPAEDLQKIEQATPAKARVQPAHSRRLLVFTWGEAFHDAVPYGARAIDLMGKKTGAFETVFSSDIKSFEPEQLKQFDAVFLNNITPINKMPKELFLPNCGEGLDKLPAAEQEKARARDAALKNSLLNWLRSGKGLAGNHSSTDCFYQWREYGEVMGGYFDGHPWNEVVGIKIDDPDHPVNTAFSGKPFEIADEIYQFKDTYSRERLHVLLSLDLTRTDMKRGGINRKDGDFGVSWVRGYGKGRVFFTSLGHRKEIFFNPTIMQHYLDGIQFALGDLKGSVAPSAEAGIKAAAK